MIESAKLTSRVVKGMLLGIALGIVFNYLLNHGGSDTKHFISKYWVNGLFALGGRLFVDLLKMLVVPIIFSSLVCGVYQLKENANVGRLAIKTIALYLCTTTVAIALAITLALVFQVGEHAQNITVAQTYTAPVSVPLISVFENLIPRNIFAVFSSNGQLLPLIIFTILFASAMVAAKEAGEKVAAFFQHLNTVLMTLVMFIMYVAPFGVLCLLAQKLATIGFDLILQLLWYFIVVIIVLLIHLCLVNGFLLMAIARLKPLPFLRKFYGVMVFAFSTASSSATIPVNLATVTEKLGVKNNIASFIIPLGATINMDGTAIMQGVATVFIANFYHLSIGIGGYLTVILMATIASIGTAGVPGVGLITLAMVLNQIGLPVAGIGLIIGIDRLLDMLRTAVNVTGDAVVSCVVANSEQAFDKSIFYSIGTKQ